MLTKFAEGHDNTSLFPFYNLFIICIADPIFYPFTQSLAVKFSRLSWEQSLWRTINKQELRECIPPPIWKFLAPPNRKSMGQYELFMIFCIQTMKWMKLKTKRVLSYIDPLTFEFFQNNGTSSISVILLSNGR